MTLTFCAFYQNLINVCEFGIELIFDKNLKNNEECKLVAPLKRRENADQ